MEAPEPITEVAPPLAGRVVMHNAWLDLTFLHWAVEPARVAHLMPPGVRPDEHEGATYVGLVPFRMVDAGPLTHVSVPFFGSFLETNVRLYSVDDAGTRGVVFLSLDTDRLAIVGGARTFFNVPYRWARMRYLQSGDVREYHSQLRRPGDPARSRVRVRAGAARESSELDRFLSARWGLHTRVLGRTRYVPNRHETWPLHDAELLELDDEVVGSVAGGELAGLTSRPPDHLAFSPGVHAFFGRPRGIGMRQA